MEGLGYSRRMKQKDAGRNFPVSFFLPSGSLMLPSSIWPQAKAGWKGNLGDVVLYRRRSHFLGRELEEIKKDERMKNERREVAEGQMENNHHALRMGQALFQVLYMY